MPEYMKFVARLIMSVEWVFYWSSFPELTGDWHVHLSGAWAVSWTVIFVPFTQIWLLQIYQSSFRLLLTCLSLFSTIPKKFFPSLLNFRSFCQIHALYSLLEIMVKDDSFDMELKTLCYNSSYNLPDYILH